MATIEAIRNDFNLMVPFFMQHQNTWAHYDEGADVLYLHFKKPNHADDSELTDDDLVIRYENGEIIGITVMNASKRGVLN